MGATVKVKPGFGPTTPARGVIHKPGTVRPKAPSMAGARKENAVNAAPNRMSFETFSIVAAPIDFQNFVIPLEAVRAYFFFRRTLTSGSSHMGREPEKADLH